jgi:hypothetical protein
MNAYDSDRDIPRLIAFVNDDPASRPGRGGGLGLNAIATTEQSRVNAGSIRRSFSVYATTHPGAELGLGIQLGHSAWRMTSGYCSDGQQQAVRHMNQTRRAILRDTAAALITGTAPVAGPAGKLVTTFRAQVITDPSRADRIASNLGERLHLGVTNDCIWNPATSGCGTARPRLADHLCIGPDCANALIRQAHQPILAQHLARYDAFLDSERGSAALRDRMQLERARIAKLIRHLDASTEQPQEE